MKKWQNESPLIESTEVTERWSGYFNKRLLRWETGRTVTQDYTETTRKPDILTTEVEHAGKQSLKYKTSECDGLPTEIVQSAGDSDFRWLHIMFNAHQAWHNNYYVWIGS